MIEESLPNLNFPKLPYGTHQSPWDMTVLLYQGGAGIRRSHREDLLRKGELGSVVRERIPLVIKLHETISAYLNRGSSPITVTTYLEQVWRFYAWADDNGASLSLEDVTGTFRMWAEFMVHRATIIKDISPLVAHKSTLMVANQIARSLGFEGKNPGNALMRTTRMRKPKTKKHVLGTQADKQNLSDTFEFGQALTDICNALDLARIRGALPFTISFGNGGEYRVLGQLKKEYKDLIHKSRDSQYANKAREPMPVDASLLGSKKRTAIINLRIESELLIFLAQSGMNLSQAYQLRKDQYRWQTDGEDVQAFRVYKGRRSGDSIFKCYKAYKKHFIRYQTWLDESGISDGDDRLFPIQYNSVIPASHKLPKFPASQAVFKKLGMRFIGPQVLRRTRVNWLLRKSRDADLTAELMGHTKRTLLANYEQPHHQSAAAEIIRFHVSSDPTFNPPGPGLCSDSGRSPLPESDIPAEAPQPDCISPEGCLFCIHHKDVLSADYCWKLTSHARIKALEVSLYKPPKKNPVHPGVLVIERIQNKLTAIAEGSNVRSQWVSAANDHVRAGNYHPEWDGYIKLIEALA